MIADSIRIPLEIMPLTEWLAIEKAAEAQLRGDECAAESWRRQAGYDLPRLTGLTNVAEYGE